MVFSQLRNNLFTSQYEEGKFLFSHLSSKQILYYVGNQVNHYHDMITLHSTVLEIFNILNKSDVLSCILCCMNVKKNFNWGEKKGYKKLDLCTGMIKMGINCINFWGRIYNFLYVLLHTSSNIIFRGPI